MFYFSIKTIFFKSAVNEYRKPKFIEPLQSQKVPLKQPVTMTAVCTADPVPEVAWFHKGEEIVEDATVSFTKDSKPIQDGLNECTFTLNIPTGSFSIKIKCNMFEL